MRPGASRLISRRISGRSIWLVRGLFFELKEADQVVGVVHYLVEQPVHQFWLLHLRDVDYNFLSAAGHPAGFGVSAAAAGENQDAGIGPFKGLQIGLELTLGLRMVQAFGILLESPFRGVFVDVRPSESIAAVGRVPEIIYFVSCFAKLCNNFGVVGVSPTGGDVDFCHDTNVCNLFLIL